MNLRSIPIIPTLVVLLAVAVMIALGLWQLDRRDQKEALLARYAQNASTGGEVAFALDASGAESLLYLRSSLDCASAGAISAKAGHDAKGRTGWAHIARCRIAGGGETDLVLGWSQDPASPAWTGGIAKGWIAPGPRLIADPPLAGLEANARPDPGDLPNNHLAYAVQWFLFALTALIIYALALRKRLRAS